MMVAIKRSSHFHAKAIIFFFLIVIGCWLAVPGPVLAGDPPDSLFDSLKEDLEKGFKSIQERMGELSKDIRSITETEEYRNLKNELERLSREAERAGRAAKEKIQKDLVPYLEEEVQKLRERLREFGRENEAEPLERQLKQIRGSATRAV